jgi:hypothetical protein
MVLLLVFHIVWIEITTADWHMHITLIPVLAASIAVALTKLSDTFQDIPRHLSPST